MSDSSRGVFDEAVAKAQEEERQRDVTNPHGRAVWAQETASDMRRSLEPARRNDYVRDMVGWSKVYREHEDRQGSGFAKVDRMADLQQQQQQTRDYVKEMVDRLKEVERQPKERREERDQGRER